MSAIEPPPYKLKKTQTSVVRPEPGGANTMMVMQEMDEPRPTHLLRRGLYNQPDKSEVLFAYAAGRARYRGARLRGESIGLGTVADASGPSVDGAGDGEPNLATALRNGTGEDERELRHAGGVSQSSAVARLAGAGNSFAWGWDMKALHRLIVTSATYRQSASASGKLLKRDPEKPLAGPCAAAAIARSSRARSGAGRQRFACGENWRRPGQTVHAAENLERSIRKEVRPRQKATTFTGAVSIRIGCGRFLHR